ncbi:hypothetical protein PV327_000999 [Microctonus hyperodae]|uniref:FAST kinase-like protein subdomain 2 domain-containing protein n=1 Tax=Microctonus hyperodae TaxID=165561 RepID=A0AA39G973_MICHY|nr:hypothetical protein PV327_000999 [Microctonus hyperodae]
MARNITNIFSLSLSIRQLMTISNNVINPRRLFRASSYCERARKNEDKVYQSPDEQKHSFMKNSLTINKLQACSSQQEVFRFLENNKKMDGLEALEVLTKLFEIEKQEKFKKSSIAQTREFAMLCHILKTNIRQLSGENAVQALKILNYFRVPTSTVIVQMILQVIRNSMNSLSIERILFLIFLLSKCQKTPLVEALSIALPIVLESCIESQLDSESVDTSTQLLQHLVNQRYQSKSISTIINVLNDSDVSLFTTNHAIKLLTNISKLNPDLAVTELLKKCQQIMINSMKDMTMNDLKSIHKILTENYRNSDDLFYNENFFEAFSTAVILKDMGFCFAVDTLARFNEFRYANNALLDYIAGKCFECENDSKMFDNKSTTVLLRAIANSGYKPVFWETMKAMMMNENLLGIPHEQMIKISIYLALLDCYWPALLEKMFTADYTKNQLSAKLQKKFLFMYNIVKQNYPEYTGPWPSDNLIQMFESSSNNPPNCVLKSALECALGGQEYVMTNIKLNMSYYIDNVIMLKKGGLPIAINNSDEAMPSTIEELRPPENCQVILFIRIPRHGYVRNTKRITGLWSLLIQTLKNQTNYTIIPIKGEMWDKISERDQVKYLSEAIRLRSDELSTVIAN